MEEKPFPENHAPVLYKLYKTTGIFLQKPASAAPFNTHKIQQCHSIVAKRRIQGKRQGFGKVYEYTDIQYADVCTVFQYLHQ
jgi:hypothetical protein